MRSLCFNFQVHQPIRLRPYRFFDMGVNHDYFDNRSNREIMQRVAQNCYLPANRLLLELIRKYEGRFRVSFSVSGTALDQFEQYAPEVLDSFQQLGKTGYVEFVAEAYAHSLAAVLSPQEFTRQVEKHVEKIEALFGQRPQTFRNTGLIYSDRIGALVNKMGFRTVLAEGADRVLQGKSPDFLYRSALNPELHLLLRNYRLSDAITFRFNNYDGGGLTAEKFVDALNAIPANGEIVNLFFGYETFGEHHWAESGIFDFLRALPGRLFAHSMYNMLTPGEVSRLHMPVDGIRMPNVVSWADEERNLSAWLGNELQDSAFEKLYQLEDKMKDCRDAELQRDWLYLQTSDHFYYQCTKTNADGYAHRFFNPYESPYEAYINYMNVISDFERRVNEHIEEHMAENANELVNELSPKSTLSVSVVPRRRKEIIQLETEPLAEKVA